MLTHLIGADSHRVCAHRNDTVSVDCVFNGGNLCASVQSFQVQLRFKKNQKNNHNGAEEKKASLKTDYRYPGDEKANQVN